MGRISSQPWTRPHLLPIRNMGQAAGGEGQEHSNSDVRGKSDSLRSGEEDIRSLCVRDKTKNKGIAAAVRIRAKINWHQIFAYKNERKEVRDMFRLKNAEGRYKRDPEQMLDMIQIYYTKLLGEKSSNSRHQYSGIRESRHRCWILW